MPPGIEYWEAPVLRSCCARRRGRDLPARMQLERAKGRYAGPSLREYSRVWGLSPYRVKPGKGDTRGRWALSRLGRR